MKPGWKIRLIPEVCFIQEGPGIRKYEYEEGGYPMINVRCVQDGYIDMSKARAANTELATGKWEHFQVQAGDILFTISGTIGRCAVVKEHDLPLLMNTSVVRFKSITDELDTDYLYYFLQSDLFKGPLLARASGTAIKNVGPTHIKKLSIVIPPLEEQRRIVALLDQSFEGLDRAHANTEANLKSARELFESALKNTFDPIPESWSSSRLIDICSKIGSGATPRGGKKSYKTEGVSLIRSMNVYDRWFKHKNLAFIDDEQAEKLNNVTVEENDVLFNITGASIARCSVTPKEVLPARVNQHVSILRPYLEILDPEFLCFLMTSEGVKKSLLEIGEEGGSTRQAITKKQLQNFVACFPEGRAQQSRIVERLKKLEALSNKPLEIAAQKISEIDNLRQSLLAKAFAGELT